VDTHEPDDDEEDGRELVRADVDPSLAGPAALAHLLDQSNREAAANRAQARELVKTLQGVQRSQEYLGTALREERSRSKALLALAILAPVLAAVGAWFVWRHVEDSRAELDLRVAQLAADAESARTSDAAKARDARVAELTEDLATVRRHLDESREELAAERKALAQREASLESAQGRADGARVEIGALEFEVKSAKSKTGAAEARADVYESRIKELELQLAQAKTAAAARPVPPAALPPAPPPAVDAPKPPETKTAAPPLAVSGDPEAIAKTVAVLNTLLKDSGDTVHYQFAALGGIAGRALTDVRVVGTDEKGTVVRTIQAARAEIVPDDASGTVVLRFTEGKLIVGSKEAPFFGGTYGLIVRADPRKWRSSGLEFVK
jgi:chaperonin cofactor prefoldin